MRVRFPVRHRRVRRLTAAVLIAGSLISAAGCSADVGTAAEFGGHTISVDAVDAAARQVLTELGEVPTDPAQAPALLQLSRNRLTTEIRHNLLERANLSSPEPVTDEQVREILSIYGSAELAEQLGVPEAEITERVKDILVLDGILGQAISSNTPITQVEVRGGTVTFPDRAAALAARAGYQADPAAFTRDALGQSASWTLQTHPDLIATGLFNAEVGGYVVIPTEVGATLVRVESRSQGTAALNVENLQNASNDGLLALSGVMLAGLVDDDQVRVNPRYGVWDPLTQQVIPGRNGI